MTCITLSSSLSISVFAAFFLPLAGCREQRSETDKKRKELDSCEDVELWQRVQVLGTLGRVTARVAPSPCFVSLGLAGGQQHYSFIGVLAATTPATRAVVR